MDLWNLVLGNNCYRLSSFILDILKFWPMLSFQSLNKILKSYPLKRRHIL